ncbi:MAG: TonB-dependent receptor plug domain-containing protein [Calditrichaeota bacterium]|jgi:hypothetical protein|nr:TonB-dependent receptor plug domain-containing protein [Calditrichota bacterium]MBT7790094.1 TonB-dependent receptor plug domain-containing protein [Calditrichota bacterium]
MFYYTKIVFTIFCALVFLFSNSVQAKIEPGNIKGRVFDASKLTPIPGANVIVVGTDMGAASDLDGGFKISGFKPGTYHIMASALGFANHSRGEVSISAGRTVTIDFHLEPMVIKGEEVTVRGGFFQDKPNLPSSTRTLSYEEVRRAPGAFEDVLRTIQAIPGVFTQNDLTNEVIVRGGSFAEHLTIIDGLEVDNINHFPDPTTSGGPMSGINIEFIEDVTFSTGGFSAKYGDRLSSILDLELRDGDKDNFRGQVETSFASAGVNLEGGIPRTNGSYLLSFRRSYIDLLKEQLSLPAVPYFWDSQFKISSELSPTVKLSMFGLYVKDWVKIDAMEEGAWSRGAETINAKDHSQALGSRLRMLMGRGFMELIIGRSEISGSYDIFDVYENILGERISDLYAFARSTETTDQVHVNLTQSTRNVDQFFAGVSLKPISFSHDVWLIVGEDDVVNSIDASTPEIAENRELRIESKKSSLKYAGYLQYRWRPIQSLSVLGGIRVDGFKFSGDVKIAPRLSAKWKINNRLSCSIAYGRYYQALTIIEYLSDDNNRNLPHKRSDHYIGGVSYLLTESTQISLEGYLKYYSNLPLSLQWMSNSVNRTQKTFQYLSVKNKETRGVEIFLQQKLSDNWYGTLAYSFAKALTTAPRYDYVDSVEVLYDLTFPADYDYRDVAAIVFGYNFSGLSVRKFQKHWYGWWTFPFPVGGDELTISSRFRYVSGRPFTPKIWTYEDSESKYLWKRSDDPNSDRYPAYSKLDIRWDCKWYTGGRSIIIFLEAQNVFDRANITEYTYPSRPIDASIPEVNKKDPVFQLGLFFVGGVRFEW